MKQGDVIAFFGQAAANSEVTININSDNNISLKTVANSEGVYLYNFITSELEKEQHLAKARAVLDNLLTANSRVVTFMVGDKNIQAVSASKVTGDVNSDAKVNLVDFSIVAYWYKRPSPPNYVDLNGDKKVDLVDFSIMAFYWTG